MIPICICFVPVLYIMIMCGTLFFSPCRYSVILCVIKTVKRIKKIKNMYQPVIFSKKKKKRVQFHVFNTIVKDTYTRTIRQKNSTVLRKKRTSGHHVIIQSIQYCYMYVLYYIIVCSLCVFLFSYKLLIDSKLFLVFYLYIFI